MALRKPLKKEQVKKATATKEALPIQKLEKPEPVPAPVDDRKDRYFIVEFTIGYNDKEDKYGQINDAVAIPAVKAYPNKNRLTEQLPGVYGITEAGEFYNIKVWNVRLTELTEEDYKNFTAS